MRKLLVILGLFCDFALFAAEVMPPAPARYFNDYAGVVSAPNVSRLNQTLEDFERATSSQIIVAVFPKMQSDSSIEDYTFRVKESWKVGQKGKDNGAVLFVFVQDHKMFLQVGYGLEGPLPDALCKRIIDQEIAPRFKAGDFEGGLSAGVSAILAATKGEYKGTGRTVADGSGRQQNSVPLPMILFGIIFMVFVLPSIFRRRRGLLFGGGGYSTFGGWGGGGGGGFSSGGGGGFSGGGGSGGGGGAGGSW